MQQSQTDLYTITIPAMAKAMRNLSAILDKAVAHAETKATARQPLAMRIDALLHERIIFDQFPLVRQIQSVSDNAKGGAARLAGIEAPKFEDTEKTIDELKARLAKTIEFIESIDRSSIIGQEARPITLTYWPDTPMTAFGYATEYLLPNFYFHLVTAYAIIRKNGVEIGKADYMGALPFTK